MYFRDSRAGPQGSAIPLAFILFVGVAALALHLYVLEIVPVMMFDSEVAAHRATLSDVREFDFAVRTAVDSGEPQPVVVGDNANYPVLFPTPPEPRYAVRTSEMENLTIENYDRICDESQSGTTDGPDPPPCENEPIQQRYETTTLLFLADYNEYQQPLVYGYEYGLVFSSPWDAQEGDDSIITYNQQDVIDGKTITLYTVTQPDTRAGRTLIYTTIVPNGTKTSFDITNTDRPINMTLATEIGESKWNDILQEEMADEGGYVQEVQYRNHTWYKDRNGGWKNCDDDFKKEKCTNGKPGNADKDHWYDCDHPGNGQPFVQCTRDNSTNYVTFVLAPGENYSVDVYEMGLDGTDDTSR